MIKADVFKRSNKVCLISSTFSFTKLHNSLYLCAKTRFKLCADALCMEFLFLGTMSGPCWDHVRPNLTSRPDTALKFSRLNQHGLRSMSTECF